MTILVFALLMATGLLMAFLLVWLNNGGDLETLKAAFRPQKFATAPKQRHKEANAYNKKPWGW